MRESRREYGGKETVRRRYRPIPERRQDAACGNFVAGRSTVSCRSDSGHFASPGASGWRTGGSVRRPHRRESLLSLFRAFLRYGWRSARKVVCGSGPIERPPFEWAVFLLVDHLAFSAGTMASVIPMAESNLNRVSSVGLEASVSIRAIAGCFTPLRQARSFCVYPAFFLPG